MLNKGEFKRNRDSNIPTINEQIINNSSLPRTFCYFCQISHEISA